MNHPAESGERKVEIGEQKAAADIDAAIDAALDAAEAAPEPKRVAYLNAYLALEDIWLEIDQERDPLAEPLLNVMEMIWHKYLAASERASLNRPSRLSSHPATDGGGDDDLKPKQAAAPRDPEVRREMKGMLAKVRAEEREACAKVAMAHEEWAKDPGRLTEEERRLIVGAAQAIAREIRSRTRLE